MGHLTYTSSLVNFDAANKLINIEVYLPKETPTNTYTIEPTYNLSKKIGGVDVNAVFCHMTDNDGEILYGDTIFPLEIDVSKLTNYVATDAVNYNFGINSTLVFVLHLNTTPVPMIDIDYIFNNLEDFIKMADIGPSAMIFKNIGKPKVIATSKM